jgi:septum formation inhibitor MinC
MKKGRFSKTEISYIKLHHETIPVGQIAENLDRDPESVENFIKEKLGDSKLKKREIEALYDLKSRLYWKEIEKQFDENELELFLYHWSRIISQFRDDVLPTEELQVIDAIKIELLMNRALREQQSNMKNIKIFEELIQDEKNKDPEYQDRDYIFNLERQVATSRAAQEALGRDYKDLQGKKSTMLKDLKATREQRIKRLEDSKQTFIGWVSQILTRPDLRREFGIEMEKMRMAMEKQKQELSGWHKYEDGIIDQPFLTPDTVKE